MNSVPKAERTKLVALQRRFRQLLAMLPTDVDELEELNISQAADLELIAAEMAVVTDQQLAILDGAVQGRSV